jgi:hypothetical protein
MSINKRIMQKAAQYGLTAQRCGNNADWADEAWHLGPSDEPNLTEGDYYIMDKTANMSYMYTLVRRFYGDGPGEDEAIIIEEDEYDVERLVRLAAAHIVGINSI